MSETVLVAGASGALGRRVVARLKENGARVRVLSRDRARGEKLGADEVFVGDALNADSLRGSCDGMNMVFSALGASVSPALGVGWRGYGAVDVPANENLLAEARGFKVKRFGYVSVFSNEVLRRTAYVQAHLAVEQRLTGSGVDHVIVRPTGFFSAIGALVDMARKGPLPTFGQGTARSNPIHDEDLANLCVDALFGSEREVDAGGPDVLSRKEMNELAFAALGSEPKHRNMPVGVGRAMSMMMRPFHPRMSQLVAFIAALSAGDAVAPVRGTRHLADYFKELAASSPLTQ